VYNLQKVPKRVQNSVYDVINLGSIIHKYNKPENAASHHGWHDTFNHD